MSSNNEVVISWWTVPYLFYSILKRDAVTVLPIHSFLSKPPDPLGWAQQGMAQQIKVRKGICQTKGQHSLTTLPRRCFNFVDVILRCHLRFFVTIAVKRELIPPLLQCLVFIENNPWVKAKRRMICIRKVLFHSDPCHSYFSGERYVPVHGLKFIVISNVWFLHI